jgi:hypothetical protein
VHDSVTALGQGLNKSGVLGIVAQSLAELVDRDSQTVVKVDGSVSAPELLLEFLAGNDLARPLQQG